MFLRTNPESADTWLPAWGPDSAIDISNGIIDTAGNGRVAQLNRGKPAAAFVEAVRRFGHSMQRQRP